MAVQPPTRRVDSKGYFIAPAGLRWLSLESNDPLYLSMWASLVCAECGGSLAEEPFCRSDGSRYTVLTCWEPEACHMHYDVFEKGPR